jgi:hypothetical protein
MEATGHPLAQMALDFMSAPGKWFRINLSSLLNIFLASSTDVERAFSSGGLTVSKMCHLLSDKSVRAATVLGSWSEIPGLIPAEKIAALFNSKSKCSKGKEVVVDQTDDGLLPEVVVVE